MAAIITYHPSIGSPNYGTGREMPVRPRQLGDNQSLAVSGTAANGTTAASPCIARVFAEEDCWVLAGASAVATTANGMPMATGMAEDFALAGGERISVIAR